MEPSLKIKGSWYNIKNQLKQLGPLNDEDLNYELGKEKDLLERLARKLGKSTQEICDLIDAMQN